MLEYSGEWQSNHYNSQSLADYTDRMDPMDRFRQKCKSVLELAAQSMNQFAGG